MSTFLLVVIYGALSVALALWNRQKGHGFLLGLLYSIFLTPVLGFLTIAVTEDVVFLKTGNGVKRSCPRCFALTPANISFCEECGAHIQRHTVKNYLQLAELFVGLVATVVIVRFLM
jgi:ribosomal protein L32